MNRWLYMVRSNFKQVVPVLYSVGTLMLLEREEFCIDLAKLA